MEGTAVLKRSPFLHPPFLSGPFLHVSLPRDNPMDGTGMVTDVGMGTQAYARAPLN